MVEVVADVTPRRKADSHPVPGLQLHGRHCGAAVLAVCTAVFSELGRRSAVDLQAGTGGLSPRGPAVDGHGEAVDSTAGSGEDAGLSVVAVPRVEEHVLVEEEAVAAEGANAGQAVLVVEGDGEGAATGCNVRERAE